MGLLAPRGEGFGWSEKVHKCRAGVSLRARLMSRQKAPPQPPPSTAPEQHTAKPKGPPPRPFAPPPQEGQGLSGAASVGPTNTPPERRYSMCSLRGARGHPALRDRILCCSRFRPPCPTPHPTWRRSHFVSCRHFPSGGVLVGASSARASGRAPIPRSAQERQRTAPSLRSKRRADPQRGLCFAPLRTHSQPIALARPYGR